jgi:His/Glu/Gln/Arg/opine family amino acid ABC transporter permease subunit
MGAPPASLSEALLRALPGLLRGLGTTLEVAFLAILIGTVLGFLLGLARIFAGPVVRALVQFPVDFVRGVPLLVMIFAFYYGLPVLGVGIAAFGTCVIALSLFMTAQTIEIVRGGIASIPQRQFEAGKAIGLGFWGRLIWVILPQAVARMMPAWTNMAVEIIKGTSLVSLVGVVDLMLSTQQAVGRTFITIPFYLLAVAMYFVIGFGLSSASRVLERRFKAAGGG